MTFLFPVGQPLNLSHWHSASFSGLLTQAFVALACGACFDCFCPSTCLPQEVSLPQRLPTWEFLLVSTYLIPPLHQGTAQPPLQPSLAAGASDGLPGIPPALVDSFVLL